MKYRDMRRPTDYPAVIVHDGTRWPVEIREISRSGVKVSGLPEEELEECEEELSLNVLNHRLPCRLRWQRQGMAGLELMGALPKSVREKIRRSGGPGSPRRAFRV